MRRNFFKSAAMALAGFFALTSKAENKITTKEVAATGVSTQSRLFLGNSTAFHTAKFYTSGGTKKTNRNRYSHNAKVKKRKAQAAR